MTERARLTGTDSDHLKIWCPACDSAHVVVLTNGWDWNENPDRPTINPSILVNAGTTSTDTPTCHALVHDGSIEYLDGTTHDLAGQTVGLPVLDPEETMP